jgi:DNA-binding response OmpR family regulator
MDIKHVLIVEDEPGYYAVLEKSLKEAGYEASVATNGAAALELLQKQTFDLILLDLIMPQKNGFEVLEEVKKIPNWPKTPILVLSNLGQPDELRRSVSLGAADHIIKANLSLSEVLDKVKLYLDR